MLKLQTSDNKQHNRSSLLPNRNTVRTPYYKNTTNKDKEMDLRTVENIERDDPSEKTLKLTTRWKKIT